MKSRINHLLSILLTTAILFAGLEKTVHVHEDGTSCESHSHCHGLDYVTHGHSCCSSHNSPTSGQQPKGGQGDLPFRPDHDHEGCTICQFSIDEGWFVLPNFELAQSPLCWTLTATSTGKANVVARFYMARAPPALLSL